MNISVYGDEAVWFDSMHHTRCVQVVQHTLNHATRFSSMDKTVVYCRVSARGGDLVAMCVACIMPNVITYTDRRAEYDAEKCGTVWHASTWFNRVTYDLKHVSLVTNLDTEAFQRDIRTSCHVVIIVTMQLSSTYWTSRFPTAVLFLVHTLTLQVTCLHPPLHKLPIFTP